MSILITGYCRILFISRLVHDMKRTCGSVMDTDTCVSGIVAPTEEDKLKGSHLGRKKVQVLIEVVNKTPVIYLNVDVRKISRCGVEKVVLAPGKLILISLPFQVFSNTSCESQR